MKKIMGSLIIFAILIPSAGFAEMLNVTVNGMVCAFCAQGIEKKFKAEAGVESVKVDLQNKYVQVVTKKGTSIKDDRAKKIIQDAGFNVVKIERK